MDDQNGNEPPPLGETGRDLVVSLGKGAVGAIPFTGPIISEIIGKLIPEQRIQRIEDYLRYLNHRFETFDPAKLLERTKDAEAIDLFEEGAVQSSRALSEERREQIANLVAYGITGEQKERIEAKRLLELLRQIDDAQIIILSSYLRKNRDNQSFHQTHADVLDPVRAHMQSSQEEIDRKIVFSLARDHLTRLGLLHPRFKAPKKGEMPEFDPKTGTMKATSRDITPLGRLLLSRIGLAEPGEF